MAFRRLHKRLTTAQRLMRFALYHALNIHHAYCIRCRHYWSKPQCCHAAQRYRARHARHDPNRLLFARIGKDLICLAAKRRAQPSTAPAKRSKTMLLQHDLAVYCWLLAHQPLAISFACTQNWQQKSYWP